MPLWLIRYLPHIALAAAFGLGTIWVVHQRARADAAEARAEAAEAAAAQAQAALERAAEDARIARKATEGYLNEIDRLRVRQPARAVRVCPQPAPRVSEVPGAPGGTDAPSAPGGELPAGTGQDIGPRLYSEADRADELAARLRALQEWLKAVE